MEYNEKDTAEKLCLFRGENSVMREGNLGSISLG